MPKLTFAYSDYLQRRDEKIFQLRKKHGESLKSLADKFKLSIRQINRIIKKEGEMR
jgi:Mor family transcriptional regulator